MQDFYRQPRNPKPVGTYGRKSFLTGDRVSDARAGLEIVISTFDEFDIPSPTDLNHGGIHERAPMLDEYEHP